LNPGWQVLDLTLEVEEGFACNTNVDKSFNLVESLHNKRKINNNSKSKRHVFSDPTEIRRAIRKEKSPAAKLTMVTVMCAPLCMNSMVCMLHLIILQFIHDHYRGDVGTAPPALPTNPPHPLPAPTCPFPPTCPCAIIWLGSKTNAA
jgi:hypothetical protein